MNNARSLHWMAAGVILLVTPLGCARKPSQELADVETALGAARAACARRYAPAELGRAERLAEEMHSLMEAGKHRRVQSAGSIALQAAAAAWAVARTRMERARAEAELAILEAEEAVAAATSSGASRQARRNLGEARVNLERARRMSAPGQCRYDQVKALAGKAAALASGVRSEARAALGTAARPGREARPSAGGGGAR